MTSHIDPSKPGVGAAFTADMRANFFAAATEISKLQEDILALQGGTGGGGDTSGLQDQIDTLKTQVTELQSQVAVLKAHRMAAAGLNIAAPPNTNSGVFITAGIGVQFIPHNSTRAIFQLDGNLGNTQNGQSSEAQLIYGTGTSPNYGTAISATNGQLIGNLVTMMAAKANDVTPFTAYALLIDLVPSTPYWLGLAFRAVGGTATLSQMGLVAFEVLDPIP